MLQRLCILLQERVGFFFLAGMEELRLLDVSRPTATRPFRSISVGTVK